MHQATDVKEEPEGIPEDAKLCPLCQGEKQLHAALGSYDPNANKVNCWTCSGKGYVKK